MTNHAEDVRRYMLELSRMGMQAEAEGNRVAFTGALTDVLCFMLTIYAESEVTAILAALPLRIASRRREAQLAERMSQLGK